MTKAKPSRHAPDEVDQYLSELPIGYRFALEHLRTLIRSIAPDSTERVSYGIPIFRLNKDLVGISAQKDHCSLHTMSPSLVKVMASELRGVNAAGATIRFPPENPLSQVLVTQIVEKRIAELKAGS